MKEFSAVAILMFVFTFAAGEFGLWEDFQRTARETHQYEYKALELSKRVRSLEKEKERLKVELAKARAEKEHLQMNLESQRPEKRTARSVASVPQKDVDDLVNFELYKWSAEKLLGVGEKALHFKKYEKSAQFYNSLMEKYPRHEAINAQVLFEAGIAAYESKKHYDWAAKHFSSLVKRYPRSNLNRGAKLWLALAHFHQGKHEKFVAAVEEFRLKYRNTREWKVLSKYYEDIAFRYKK